MAATTDKNTARPRRKAEAKDQTKPVSIRAVLPPELANLFYQFVDESHISQTAFLSQLVTWFFHQSPSFKMAILQKQSASSAVLMARLLTDVEKDLGERTIAAHKWTELLEDGELGEFFGEGIKTMPIEGTPQNRIGRKRNK